MALIFLLSLIQASPAKRVLDVYTKDANYLTYLDQVSILHADPKGLKERDVVVRYHLDAQVFKVVLTGKDGSKKYSSTKFLSLAKLYSIIDAMPMRKEEMANQFRRP